MEKKRAFTLIELLVVIAVIAVLMAILMPALRKARQQARNVMCMSNLKQWGSIWSMYLNDSEGVFPPGTTGVWVEPLRPYYGNAGEKIRVCPTATKSEDEGGLEWFIAWDVDNEQGEEEKDFRGSYGINNWVYNPSGETLWSMDTEHCWRRSDVKGADQVPLFLDCWRWGGAPEDTDRPYTTPPMTANQYQHGMNRYCLNRHSGHVNILFMDLSVRKTSLKSLWTLKWHKDFRTMGYKYPWPDWMKGLPE